MDYVQIDSLILQADIAPNDKLLYGVMDTDCKDKGQAYTDATNADLAKTLNLIPKTIPTILNRLKKGGYIRIKYSTEGIRCIYPTKME